jgi:hypothetical protein
MIKFTSTSTSTSKRTNNRYWCRRGYILTQDRCTVYAERTKGSTKGSEIILDTHVEVLGYEAQLEAHFGPFGDSANLDAR